MVDNRAGFKSLKIAGVKNRRRRLRQDGWCGTPVKIKNPTKYLNSFVRRRVYDPR